MQVAHQPHGLSNLWSETLIPPGKGSVALCGLRNCTLVKGRRISVTLHDCLDVRNCVGGESLCNVSGLTLLGGRRRCRGHCCAGRRNSDWPVLVYLCKARGQVRISTRIGGIDLGCCASKGVSPLLGGKARFNPVVLVERQRFPLCPGSVAHRALRLILFQAGVLVALHEVKRRQFHGGPVGDRILEVDAKGLLLQVL